MKNLVWAWLTLAFLGGCNAEHKRPVEKDLLTEDEIKDFITGYDKTWERRDTARMKEIMDEKYIYFSSTGSTTDRSAIISWFTPVDKYKVDTAIRAEIVVVQIKGNTAIVSSRWIGSGTFDKEKFKDDQRCGLVIQKQDGKLKLIAEHCTQIAR